MSISGVLIGVGTAAALVVAYALIGNIPVGGGAGWDGTVYLNYVETLGRGGLILGDVYRLSRVAGFAPLILASALGVPHTRLIELQTFLNIIMMSGGAVLLHDSLRQLGVKNREAALSTVLMIVSWPVLVMSIYSPILSDNLAIPISCLSLWLWTRSWQRSLYALSAYSVWVMPGLFLVPLVLAVMRRDLPIERRILPKRHWVTYFGTFLIFAGAFLAFAVMKLSEFSADDKFHRMVSLWGQTAVPSLQQLSSMYLVAAGISICWIFAAIGLHPVSIASIDFRSVFSAGTWVAASAVMLWLLAFNFGGYAGPPLLDFFLVQTLAAPAKPLVAHFAYFGPVIVLAAGTCLQKSLVGEPGVPHALWVLFACFLPFLAFGSESRQWIGIFPIAVAIFAVSERSEAQYWLCLLFSMMLVIPMFWLKPSILAIYGASTNFQNVDWQNYFGRHGPWMSVESYRIAAVALLAFISATLACRIWTTRTVYRASMTRPRT